MQALAAAMSLAKSPATPSSSPWQKEEFARLLDAELVPDLVARLQARYEDDRSRSAATKVDFFTMVRGEDKD